MNEVVAAELNGQRYYLVPAPDGSVDSMIDAAGNVVETYDYTLTGIPIVLDARRRPLPGSPKPKCRLGFHGHVYDPDTGLLDVRHRRFHTDLGQFLSADPTALVKSGNAYAMANHDSVNSTDLTGFEDSYIDWREAVVPFAIPLLTLAVITLGIIAFPVIAPYVAAIGIGLLLLSFGYHVYERASSGQGFFSSLAGGVLDTFGVSQILQGAFQYDLATLSHVKLTPQQRGQLLGGGLGTALSFIAGVRIFGGRSPLINRWGGRFDGWRSGFPRTAMTLRARSPGFLGRGRVSSTHKWVAGLRETITNPGRLPTLVDAIDALVLRLHSMPRRGMPFRESSVLRMGTDKGGDLWFQTANGAGERGGLPEGVEESIYRPIRGSRVDPGEDGPRGPGLIDEYPTLLIKGRTHVHPPFETGSYEGHSITIPGYLTGGDDGFIRFEFLEEPLASRIDPGTQVIVVRIGPNGAPQDVGVIELRPPVPSAPVSTAAPPPPPRPAAPPSFFALPDPDDENR